MRDQVRRDRLRHREPEDPLAGLLGLHQRVGRHHGGQALRHADDRRVRDPAPGRILERDPRSGVDRLRLREQERPGLARRQRRAPATAARWPTAPSGTRCGPASSPAAAGSSSREPRIGSAVPSWNVAGANGLSGSAFDDRVPTFTIVSPRVSSWSGTASADARLPLDVQDRHPRQLLAVEVNRQVEVQVGDPDLLRIPQRVRVLPDAAGRPPPRRLRSRRQMQDRRGPRTTTRDGDHSDHQRRRGAHRDDPLPDPMVRCRLSATRLSLRRAPGQTGPPRAVSPRRRPPERRSDGKKPACTSGSILHRIPKMPRFNAIGDRS